MSLDAALSCACVPGTNTKCLQHAPGWNVPAFADRHGDTRPVVAEKLYNSCEDPDCERKAEAKVTVFLFPGNRDTWLARQCRVFRLCGNCAEIVAAAARARA